MGACDLREVFFANEYSSIHHNSIKYILTRESDNKSDNLTNLN